MPGMVPTTASIESRQVGHDRVEVGEAIIENPTTLASSGDISWSERVAFGSSLANSMATPLSRSVRPRSAEADSDSEGSDASSMPDGLLEPRDGTGDPEGGEIDARTGFVDAPVELIEQGHQAIHPFGDLVDGVERGQRRGGKSEDCARKADQRFEQRRRVSTR